MILVSKFKEKFMHRKLLKNKFTFLLTIVRLRIINTLFLRMKLILN